MRAIGRWRQSGSVPRAVDTKNSDIRTLRSAAGGAEVKAVRNVLRGVTFVTRIPIVFFFLFGRLVRLVVCLCSCVYIPRAYRADDGAIIVSPRCGQCDNRKQLEYDVVGDVVMVVMWKPWCRALWHSRTDNTRLIHPYGVAAVYST